MKTMGTIVRCPICDWSPSNEKSLFNHKLSEVKGPNRFTICDDGAEMCLQCYTSSKKLNRKFIPIEDLGSSKYIIDKDFDAGYAIDNDGESGYEGKVSLGNGGYWKRPRHD